MTNTPSPTDEDRELIAKLRYGEGVTSWWELGAQAADRLESLLSDRAKLEEALLEARSWLEFYGGDYGSLGSVLECIDVALNRSTDHTP